MLCTGHEMSVVRETEGGREEDAHRCQECLVRQLYLVVEQFPRGLAHHRELVVVDTVLCGVHVTDALLQLLQQHSIQTTVSPTLSVGEPTLDRMRISQNYLLGTSV